MEMVNTGLDESGSVHKDYKILVSGEKAVETVDYDEWVRRMKLAGQWREPIDGIRWEPLDS